MFAILLTLSSFALAGPTQTRVLKSNLAEVTIEKIERLEAEPVSKPFEIAATIQCKNNKHKVTQKINLPVCDFDLQDKETKISKDTIYLAHFAWDGAKSSNNPDGRNYCDSKQKLFHEIKISEICKPPVKK
jgi:hypothetical protein